MRRLLNCDVRCLLSGFLIWRWLGAQHGVAERDRQHASRWVFCISGGTQVKETTPQMHKSFTTMLSCLQCVWSQGFTNKKGV